MSDRLGIRFCLWYDVKERVKPTWCFWQGASPCGVRSSQPLLARVAATTRREPNEVVKADKCERSAEPAPQPSLEAIAAGDAEASLSEACPEKGRREPSAVISHAGLVLSKAEGIRGGRGWVTALSTATGGTLAKR
jgi:hypothetical protein